MASETYRRVTLRSIPELELVEAHRRHRSQHQLAAAMQQSGSHQIADRSLDPIPLLEVVGIVGELADDLLDRQLRWILIEQVCEDARLRSPILLCGADVQRPGTLLPHGRGGPVRSRYAGRVERALTWVLRAEVVRDSIVVLQRQSIHPYFPAYLHLVQRAAAEGQAAEIKASWKPQLGPYLEVAGAPSSHPYYRPFWEGSGSVDRGWLNGNLAGSFARSSLRAGQPALKVVQPHARGYFSLLDDHWVRCREHLLFGERIPVIHLAAWLFRDFGFQVDGDPPSHRELVAVFAQEFGYESPESEPFRHLYSLPAAGDREWFEPFAAEGEVL